MNAKQGSSVYISVFGAIRRGIDDILQRDNKTTATEKSCLSASVLFSVIINTQTCFFPWLFEVFESPQSSDPEH